MNNKFGITRFTLALIGRHAPLLDPAQVAAIRGVDVPTLDQWCNGLDDGEQLAEFVVWLQDRQADMRALLYLEQKPGELEAGYERLKVAYRETPVGDRLEVPLPGGHRVRNAQDAAARVIGLAVGRGRGVS